MLKSYNDENRERCSRCIRSIYVIIRIICIKVRRERRVFDLKFAETAPGLLVFSALYIDTAIENWAQDNRDISTCMTRLIDCV